MRRARALRAFWAGDDTEWDWAGALLVSEGLEKLEGLHDMFEGLMRGLSKK